MIRDIHSQSDMDEEFLEKKGLILLELAAGWCRPCQLMEHAFSGVEEKFGGKIRLCRIDVDELEETESLFNLQGVPTFILFDGDSELGRIIGFRQEEKFFEDIDRFLH